MVEPHGIALVVQRLPQGDCRVSLSPPYEGLDTVLVLSSIGQVWPSPEKSAWAAQEFEPESAVFAFEPVYQHWHRSEKRKRAEGFAAPARTRCASSVCSDLLPERPVVRGRVQ